MWQRAAWGRRRIEAKADPWRGRRVRPSPLPRMFLTIAAWLRGMRYAFSKPVYVALVLLLSAYFVFLPFVLLDALSQTLTAIAGAATDSRHTVVFGRSPLNATLQMGTSGLLHVLAFTAGAMGAYVHAVTSFVDFVGNGKFGARWAPWLMLRPFAGATLALGFIALMSVGLVGFADGQSAVGVPGIVAISFLVGLFSRQATDKLKVVADNLFKSPINDHRADKMDSPRVPAPDVPSRVLKVKDRAEDVVNVPVLAPRK